MLRDLMGYLYLRCVGNLRKSARSHTKAKIQMCYHSLSNNMTGGDTEVPPPSVVVSFGSVYPSPKKAHNSLQSLMEKNIARLDRTPPTPTSHD